MYLFELLARSVVRPRDGGGSRRGATLVRAILGLAKALHLDVVAEGIELPEQLTRLQESGCETGQGFLFATPVVTAEIDLLLMRATSVGDRAVHPSSLPQPESVRVVDSSK